jgi:hypothetical protein
MRFRTIFFLSMLLAACASPAIRCDGKLTAINPRGGVVAPGGASGSKP